MDRQEGSMGTNHASQPSLSDLEALAGLVGFGQLNDAERRLLRGVPRGNYVFFGPSEDPKDLSNDPNKSDDWGKQREIRADLVRWLCADPPASRRIHHTGIFLLGAKITGAMNLSFVNLPFPLTLRQCRLTEPTWLIATHIPFLDLAGSWLHSMMADGASFEHTVFFVYGFRVDHGMRLANVKIGGDLACKGGKFRSEPGSGLSGNGKAISAEGAQIARHAFLDDGFIAWANNQIMSKSS
jgi:hypothetical protein